jgi:drug/metabolite transporter (DMT)-like permease
MNTSFIFALLAAALFGISTPLAKLMVGNTDPWLQAGILYFGSGIGVFVLFVFQNSRSKNKEKSISRADLPWLLAATIFGGGLGPVLLMYGLSKSTASSSALLLNFEAVLTSVLAWTVFKEHFEKRIVLGMVAIVIGGAILSWSQNFSWGQLIGPCFIFFACLSWAVDNNLTRKISASNPIQITMIKSILAGATNITIAVLLGARFPSIQMTAIISVIGFFGYGLSLISRTGAYFSTAPFLGATISLILFREPLTPQFFLAFIFMGLGVWLHMTELHIHEHSHEFLVHEHRHTHDEHHQHEHPNDIDPKASHSHQHTHTPLTHSHAHFPDIHHQHEHK